MLAWVSKKETAMASSMIEGMMYTLGGVLPKNLFFHGLFTCIQRQPVEIVTDIKCESRQKKTCYEKVYVEEEYRFQHIIVVP
jgi:hypothetical protein